MGHPVISSRSVATAVRAALAGADLTVVETAARTGIAKTTLDRRLSGGSPFTVDELAAIASIASTTVSGLMRQAETYEAGAA